MSVEKLLIANRGEIAIRIARAAEELDIATVAIHSEDDGSSLHTRVTNESVELNNRGVAAYLDIDQIVDTALSTGCDAVHPGYGFLAENADFARALEAAGIVFVGPSSEQLALFGDKLSARASSRTRCATSPSHGGSGDAQRSRRFSFRARRNHD
jgi:acetyl/propionyl-CoA carboxylase alpha subunit